MNRIFTIIVLAISCVLLIACSSSQPLTAEDVDKDTLLASLLALEDMPTGWSIDEAAEFETRTPGGTYDIYCATLPARSIAAATAGFGAGSFGPFMFQNIVIYPDARSAEDALTDLIAASQKCPEETGEDGNTSTYSPLSFPSIGDQSFALRTTAGLAVIDGVRVRVGNAIVTVSHSGVGGVDSKQTETFIRAAVDKFKKTLR